MLSEDTMSPAKGPRLLPFGRGIALQIIQLGVGLPCTFTSNSCKHTARYSITNFIASSVKLQRYF